MNIEKRLDEVIAIAMMFGAELLMVGMIIGLLATNVFNKQPEMRGTYEENLRAEALETTENVLAAFGLWHIEE